jgi:uncharacterized protein with HEPN domain
MSPRAWQERIKDILTSAHNIESYIAGMTLDGFLADPRTVRAVAFEFTTIGEAARAVPGEIQQK